jgi:hypothetical protein
MKKLAALVFIFLSFSSFAQVNLSEGLSAHWKLDGSFLDASGNGFTGTPVNQPGFGKDRRMIDSSSFFSDSAGRIVNFGDILDTVFAKTTAYFSISGWAKTTALPPVRGGNMIITKSAGGIGPYQWAINHDTDGRVYALVAGDKNASAFIERMSSQKIPLNTWFHFVLRFDGSLASSDLRMTFFVDGIAGGISRLVGTPGTGTENTNQVISIGGSLISGVVANPYPGSIDEVRIYNRVLTMDEVDSLAAISATGTPNPTGLAYTCTVYPNPAGNKILLEPNRPQPGRGTFLITDVKGNEVLSFANADLSGKTEINISGLVPGIYFITVKDEQNMKPVRFIRQ